MVRETRHLWVGNLPETVREDRIREHFKRYGRVQSVKILLSSNCNPNLLLSIGSSSVQIKDHNDTTDDHSISMYNFNNNVSLCSPTTNSSNCNIGSVCATVAFMDIKSASKAHTAEHKFDDRVLTTEYYEPSSIPSTSGENSPSSISSLTAQQQTAQQQPSPQHGSTTSNLSGSVQQSVQQQYLSSTTVSPPAVAHRLSTSNHGSSEDLSPNFVDRNVSMYDRSTRLSESSSSEMYIRRPNNFHHNESRSRPRDRIYSRNGSYSSTVDRSNSSILHRSSSNTWYENSNVSNSSRNVYGNLPSAAVVVTPDSAYDTTTDRRTSETECSSKSISKSRGLKKKKSHSGSESPGGDSTTSRSNSRSPSCSSTNSGSSRSHGSSSPTSSDKSRVRNLQSAVSTPATNSSSNSNPAVHSEDNRPLAICVRNLPSRSSDTSLKDGLFHEYKKHGKVTWVKVVGQSSERYALVCFKKPEDVVKALEVSHDKLFFGCKIAVAPYQGFDVDDNEFRPYEAELDEYHPKATRTLFIGNLEKDITATELRKNFDSFGEIIEIDIKKQGVNAYAFCQYADIVSVVKAMRQMDGEHLGSTRIKLGFGKSMPTNCVWIDGVSEAASENYLNTQFSRFGPVTQANINRERKTALVFFDQISCAQTAVKEMRGVTLRGRKLQVDFASRECQDTFYEKLKKKGAATPERQVFETNREVARTFENATTLTNRFGRYDTPSRSRTSSITRHGAVSPSSTTARNFARKNSRYVNADYHEDEFAATDNCTAYAKKNANECESDRRIKSYDEFSQGSAASHEAEEYNYLSPQERLAAPSEIDSTVPPANRRKYEDEFAYAKKSAFVNDVDAERRDKSPVVDEEYFSKHHRVQSVVVSADSATNATAHFQQPGDIRNLQKERTQLLEQLEEYPSSGDEKSPRKRMKFDNADSGNLVQTTLINDSNCDVTLNNLNDSNLLHRKNAEVRRLSESNSAKLANSIRRPSGDSGSMKQSQVRTATSSHTDEPLTTYQAHPFTKRRKTAITNSESEHHSKGRGHQLHSLHSHEASASESADGSRPGTPLCDERPEVIVPADPRRNMRDRYTSSHAVSLYLPLPKFGIQIFQQNRAFSSTHSLSSYLLSSHSSRNTLSSPPPALLTRPSSNGGNILLSSSQHSHQHNFQPKQHSHQAERSSSHQPTSVESKASHHQSTTHHTVSTSQTVQPPAAPPTPAPQETKQPKPPQPPPADPIIKPVSTVSLIKPAPPVEQPPQSPSNGPAMSTRSSDSELGTSPSFDERIKSLDEMFDTWNGTIMTKSGAVTTDAATPGTPGFLGKHKFLDLDVNDMPPSDILQSIINKKSIFDDDFKRLENIGEKYEPKEYANLNRTAINAIKANATLTSGSQLPKLVSNPQPATFTAQISQALPRLNAVSPMNSPQPQSPYNSPSPSPIVVTPNMSGAKMTNNVAPAVAPVKGLQYPFPTHPPVASSVTNVPPAPPTNKNAEISSSSQEDTSKSKSHSSSKNAAEKSSSKSSNSHRSLNKSASVPGSNHSGTVRATLTQSCSLNIKEESSDSLDNATPSRKTSREEKHSKHHEHPKKTDLLDRRKWESISSENSDFASSSEILAEKTENERRERHETNKVESRNKCKSSRNQSEIEAAEEPRVKYEHEPKKNDEHEYRRRDVESEEAVHNWKPEYPKPPPIPPKERNEHVTANHYNKGDKHNKENTKSRESTPLDRYQYSDDAKNASKSSRSNSPSKSMPKRRLSSHESVDSDDGKRFKFNSENAKILERRDFKDPNGRSSDKSKHHRSSHKVNNVHKSEETPPEAMEDKSKKDTTLDDRKKDRESDRHRSRSDKSSHKSSRRPKEEKPSQFHMHAQSGFSNEGRLSEDDKKSEHSSKDSKRTSFGEHHSSHRHHGHDSKHNSREHRDDKSKSEKRMDRINSNEKRSRDDAHASSKPPAEQRQRVRKQLSNSSDDSDSDAKKHSIFETNDEGPVYISMYDKVKARSCKNMKKQTTDDKKIKDKFSQLKQSRAKREEKKNSNSYDEDSDSDVDCHEHRAKHTSGKMKPFLDSSTEDSDDRRSAHKEVSDSGSSSRKGHSHMNRLNELCDGESSENSSLHEFPVKPRERISSRKNSKSARITPETSDDASQSNAIKQEPMVKSEDIKCEIKTEVKEEKPDIGQFKIKSEPTEFAYDNQMPERACDLSDVDSITPNSKASETKESVFDNLFNSEAKKRHKKNKKRQKSPPAPPPAEEPKPVKHEEAKISKSNSMENMFDELKRDSSSKDKRHGRKDKKRDKSSKEPHDKLKDDKYRTKKMKKQNRLSSDASMFESQESFSSSKIRGEKMEDIFGPISDDDSLLSSIEVHKPVTKPTSSNNGHSNRSSTQHATQNENHSEPKTSAHADKEKHREKKREKRRKEREKQQQSISSKDDDNSVDLDAAGRALEAQLMEDCDPKPEEITEFTYSSSKENVNKNSIHETPPETDVFRFSETEECTDMFTLRKAESAESHRSKDKKKKKKRSKDEKRHHHHHSSHSTSFISPPTTPRLTIDTSELEDLPPSKPSSASMSDRKSSEEPADKADVSSFKHVDEKPSKIIDNKQSKQSDEKHVKNADDKQTKHSDDKHLKHADDKQFKHSDDKRKESKAIIPGFGMEIDTNIYDSAVQSISSDFKDKCETEKAPAEPKSTENPEHKPNEKIEEKSRVVISQEETEDAVAALLGESFSLSYDYSFGEDGIGEEGSTLQASNDAIAEEEAEEMRQAVQSLNKEELDMKPDTPQSDNGLQIDTDTEEPDDRNALQIDESSWSPTKKPEQTKDIKKSPQKKTESESSKLSEKAKPIEVKSSSDDNVKTHAEPKVLPPIIPKMVSSVDAPSDLPKPNIVQVPTVSNEKPKPSPPSSIIHHTQSAVVTPTPTHQNPILNRVATPQIRQSLHISPAKSSLSHVVIQQRQIVPPTTQSKPATSNPSSNRTSTVVVPPSAAKPIENEPKVDADPPLSTLVTQMPQTPKQIVFETKIHEKPEIKEEKPAKMVEAAEDYRSTKPTEIVKDEVTVAATSVIMNVASKVEEIKPKEEVAKPVKEEPDYWTAKEVNIESVIKKVDALCTDDEANVVSKNVVKQELPKLESDASKKDDAKADTAKNDAKNQAKREKSTRNKKPATELESQKSPPPAGNNPDVQAGVQTRRGVTKPPPQNKRNRNSRNVSPRSKTSNVVPGGESKSRSNNSESDIYEFHEDSGDESINESPRARALSISKPSTQPPSPNTVHVEPIKQTQPTVISAPEPEQKPVQSPETKAVEAEDESKEDLAALNNVRKSLRLIERDGTRNTIDDTIEDVIKNMSKEQTVITTSATVVQPAHIQPRRSTRSTTNQTPNKLTTTEKTDLRKSPRPNRTVKELKLTGNDHADNKADERNDHEEKRFDDSEATQSASESGETRKEAPRVEVIEGPKIQHAIVKEMRGDIEKRHPSGEPMALIDPVTGEMTVVQQSNEGQYVPVVSGGEFVNKPSVLVTSRDIRSIVEPTATLPKVSVAPVVTIVSTPVLTQAVPMQMPHPVPTTASVHVQKSLVITSKQVEPTHTAHAIPLSMSIEKTLAQSAPQPQIQIQPVVQHHPMKAHVLGSQHVKISQAPVISSAATPVILSTSVSSAVNVQPVIKSTSIIHSSVAQPNIPTHKYGKDTPSVIAQQPQYQHQPPPKIQVSNAQPSPHISAAHKNTLIVNIPSSSPANVPPPHSPRHSPNIPKVAHSQNAMHESQYSIHVPKHSVANIHQPQIMSQKPVVISKVHMPPISSNYTSVVSSSKMIQSPHHMPQPMVSMGSPMPMPMQHISHPTKSSHQITIQSTQPHYVSSMGMPVRSTATKYETVPSPKFKQQIMPPNLPPMQSQPVTITQQPQSVGKQTTFPTQSIPPSNQIRLHQASQIMTGAVASPPLKQTHLTSQQPIVAGANSSRVSVPSLSPQGQPGRPHNLQQPGLPVTGFEANLHSDIGGFGLHRNHSPPPAHQQASPITPVNLADANFPSAIRNVPNPYFMFNPYIRQEQLSHAARIPYHLPRLTSATEQKELNELDEQMGTSPPLEMRRTVAAQRVAVPHNIQSPQDRATVIPHPHYPDVGARFYENARSALPAPTEPPPAHRNMMSGTPPINYAPATELHLLPKALEREREQREKERKSSIPGHSNTPCPSGLVPAMATPGPGRSLQVATPPHASQVPPQADSLLMLLQRYPVMWQGLLALKTDQAAVQMHFVFGNPDVASGSLPCNSDGSTPPLRIAQRMRLEQTQLEGVARKMQTDNEHCMLLALPCGRDHLDVLQQSTNLQTGFITYLQQKQAAGIVNIPAPGSEQAAYVVHIFPSCEFANENLNRIAPDLLHRVADIAHLLIVIATV